ncbi:hypothetical protein OSB04_008622 [Centaurea solstitialis]|uniref:RING-type E3 ubiquitin transferase n=1 Tax=Centaurea solstitialis TaxID=347529 RepID=A0AA38WJN2_9ASTR|nr:hypothetical protein OSB04_008622 [Centaurea solstitialis]
MEAITSTSSMAAAEFITQTIELLSEAAVEAKNLFVEKESFLELTSYLNRVVPLLKELKKRDISNVENSFVEILNQQVKVVKQLMAECKKKNRVYLLVNCRSITKRLQNITREISRALSLVPLSQLDISASMVQELNQLCESMQSVEFKTAIADETILEKIETGIHERNADRSYANNVLISIAQALGIPTERSALKKEIEAFKTPKDHAEAIQMDQIILLLEKADATHSTEEKERSYLTKRTSLGSQPLEPLQSFYCPITGEVMVDPVETSSGHTFERSAIEKWLADGSNLCPLTMIPLENSVLRPNRTLRQSIEEWKDRNTMITIASIKSKLLKPSSGNEEEVISCLEQLQNLCEQRDIQREWIVLENYIPIFVELLGGRNRDIRTRALVMLCPLAKDSNDAKYYLDPEHRDAFLAGSEDVKLSMVTTLAEMELTDHSKSSLFEGGALDSLLHLLSNGNPKMKETAAKALCNLSSLPKSTMKMIKEGSVNLLVNILYNQTSSHCLQDEVAAIIMHLATSTMSQNSNGTPISLLESDGDIHSLFSFIGCTRPSVQESLLHAFYAMCHSPLAATVKAKLRQLEKKQVVNCQTLVLEVAYSVKHLMLPNFFLFYCLQNSENEELLVSLCKDEHPKVRANAVKLFCCLTEDGNDKEIIDRMGQQSIETLIKIIQSCSNEEETASALCVISRLNKHSLDFNFLCGSFDYSESGCPVHQGICTVESSFCLVEANAVSPLVTLLGDPDQDVCEASLDALLTLIKAERLPYGSKVLSEANGIHPIIKLLNSTSSSLQEKVLNALERIFRQVEFKQRYGPLAQSPLVELTQRGNSKTKSLAARILAQLNVLHDQSSYF